ncbi:MAG: hypothetical protein A3C07_02720 [Candidatus Sungbacteria bacterium RIFCSPHIGHO2_02_FULL_47_11]|uniref:Uncharacterized protein n=1 Tax=Candidatus Sungbacteria bacterium RIFCSPHIGHO2_02_FULL_47_11 TaxID=1802270 RepID=A0A1G2KHZ5_9BACT|nr:MAG: hypothetical protein A3C07_02720 [Candidatus Sungbacteria bacterium RIFCSPHIGHO2_02_FULL_47_11]
MFNQTALQSGFFVTTPQQTCLPAEAPTRAVSAAGGSAQAGECWDMVCGRKIVLDKRRNK